MNFGEALEALKKGKKVIREGWNGNGIFIKLHSILADEECTQPYIVIDTTGLRSENAAAKRGIVPWLASQTDLLAEDWAIME